MPWRLYRYIVADLLRILVLTTGVLVLVMAFGATIKPLSEGALADAGQIMKYICLAIVPMLQFSLPFAAGFAGTISLHRMTADNEVLAAAASGLSYRRLLTPVFALGLVLCGIMLILTQLIIPKFWGLLERTVAQDMTMFFQAPIQRGEAFELGDWQIFADQLVVEDEPDTGADTRLILLRVVVADLDENRRIETDVTANQIVVDIYRQTGATWIKLLMTDTVVSQPEEGTLSYSPKIEPDAIVIPSVFEDAPGRMTRPELLELRENPDGYSKVLKARTNLARGLRDAEISRRVHGRLRREGAITLRSLGPQRRHYIVAADRMRADRFLFDDGRPVEVEELSDGVATRRIRATEVSLVRSASSESLGPVTFALQIEDAEVTDVSVPDTPNVRKELFLENLVPDGVKVSAETQRSSAELLAAVKELRGSREGVNPLARELERRLRQLEREITARLVTRPTVSLTALLLLLLGATLAMWRRNSLPLAIYVLAFLPSILDLVMINSGEQLVRDGAVVTGIVVMWAGNGLLIAFWLVAYLRLRRN